MIRNKTRVSVLSTSIEQSSRVAIKKEKKRKKRDPDEKKELKLFLFYMPSSCIKKVLRNPFEQPLKLL